MTHLIKDDMQMAYKKKGMFNITHHYQSLINNDQAYTATTRFRKVKPTTC